MTKDMILPDGKHEGFPVVVLTGVSSFDVLRRLWLKLVPEDDVWRAGLRHRAAELLDVSESLYGAEHRPASEIPQTCRVYPVAIADHIKNFSRRSVLAHQSPFTPIVLYS
ncbi:hypothetical protein HJB89_31425 [Rhizobium sp. NZLR8]|uniref:hypothetical protein n=1 Tax=Rhizobium sp. NZLR8 TaxID=2731104 RepID=UPI001C83D021|nr:hypothetical protein [Rhizobium sp. NZLR8]MBX5161561.1 hypothetical protein [Rhizobium sp. NZLR8]